MSFVDSLAPVFLLLFFVRLFNAAWPLLKHKHFRLVPGSILGGIAALGLVLRIIYAAGGATATFSEVVGLNVSNTTVYLFGLVTLLVFVGVRAAESWDSAVVSQLRGVVLVKQEKQKLWDMRDRQTAK